MWGPRNVQQDAHLLLQYPVPPREPRTIIFVLAGYRVELFPAPRSEQALTPGSVAPDLRRL